MADRTRDRLRDGIEHLLARSHRLRPDSLAEAVDTAVHGVDGSAVPYVVDYQQQVLVSLAQPDQVLDVDGSLAGRAYRTTTVLTTRADDHDVWWVPMLDGADRHGVLRVQLPPGLDELEPQLRSLASVTAELLVSKAQVGDSITMIRRRQDMTLAAELRWAMLPPLTFANDAVEIAAVLEPAYEIAGDTFDYTLDGELTHVAIFDAMGHGLEASRLANLAVISYRHSRRLGSDLPEIVEAMDAVVVEQFGDARFVTAQVARLDTRTGRLELVSAGHPPPLLVRHGSVVGELTGRVTQPVGLGLLEPTVNTFALEPGDRVVFYTDGVTEARSATGEEFGIERLVDFVSRATSSGEPVAETLRRLIHQVLDHEAGRLRDDATVVLLGWPGPPS